MKKYTQLKRRKDAVMDVQEAFLWYFQKGMKMSEIAKHQGVSVQLISKTLLPFTKMLRSQDALNRLDVFRERKAEILDFAELTLIGDILDGEKRKNATQGNAAYAYDKIFHSNRLVQGKSTDNTVSLDVDIVKLNEQNRDIQAEIDQIEQELREEPASPPAHRTGESEVIDAEIVEDATESKGSEDRGDCEFDFW